MTNALVPQTNDKATDLTSLLRTLTDQKDTKASVTPAGPSDLVGVAEDAVKALSSLSEQLRTVTVPSDRRQLTSQELYDLAKLADTAKKAEKSVKAAVAATKTAVFNDFDVKLEEVTESEEGEAPFAMNKDGHYLVTEEAAVPDLGIRLTRELSERAPTITAKDLHTLWQAGKISREVYYSCTRALEVPREVDDEGLLEAMQNEKVREAIAGAITPGDVTASFHVRPFKKAT